MNLVVGTRGSALALAQARSIVEQLGGSAELRVIRTAGDASGAPLATLGDGAFVVAIERALLAGEIDVAVHSLKDLPTEDRPDLRIAAIPPREDPRDVLITRRRGGLTTLAKRYLVGTSSPRRAAFVRHLSPGAAVRDIRGNVETRMRKVASGEYDATVLALAGLRRLGVAVGPAEILPIADCPPAPGQGALAVQCRRGDDVLGRRLAALDHRPTRLAVEAERALLRALGGDCTLPLGAHGSITGGAVVLHAWLALEDRLVTASASASTPGDAADRIAADLGRYAGA